MNKFKIKENTHLVLKEDDIKTYLTNEEQKILDVLYEKVMLYRNNNGKKNNKYYIVNQDEPYADKVLEIIKIGEGEKDE